MDELQTTVPEFPLRSFTDKEEKVVAIDGWCQPLNVETWLLLIKYIYFHLTRYPTSNRRGPCLDLLFFVYTPRVILGFSQLQTLSLPLTILPIMVLLQVTSFSTRAHRSEKDFLSNIIV